MSPSNTDRITLSVVSPSPELSRPEPICLGILARGGWYVMPEERDMISAYHRALESGMGVVVPVRDYDGRLVISRGPASSDAPPFDEFLDDRPVWPGRPTSVAIQICADGLSKLIHRSLRQVDGIMPYVFGISITDMAEYMDGLIPIFVRQSEHEPQPSFYEFAEGVWLDSFERDWFDERLIIQHLGAGKIVTVVSPEINSREHDKMWEMLAGLQGKLGDLANSIQLCTDKPAEARSFFHP